MAKAKKVEAPTLVVVSKAKEFAKGLGDFNVSSEFFPALNEKVAALVEDAAKRCSTNNRKTLKAGDL